MTSLEKISELRNRIFQQLAPLITSNYWLMEVPHYDNVGDTLIWQGEMDFLRHIPCKCLGMRALDSWKQAKVKQGDLILFQGGGNFGDLWTKHHDFKMKVVAEHPHNTFLFFPQTVYFEHEENMRKCAQFLSNYDVIICARDMVSFEILRANFRNKILLVPDMAFCMDMTRWTRKSYQPKKPLYLKRTDKEFLESEQISNVLLCRTDMDISDWKPMVNPCWINVWQQRIAFRPLKLGWLYDPYMFYIYRPYLIQSGVNQLMQHTDIYSTRLHACILSILLGKEKIVFVDNSYGKNRHFYETWLKDCQSVTMLG